MIKKTTGFQPDAANRLELHREIHLHRVTREQAEAAQDAVFTFVPDPEDRRLIMRMLFENPRANRYDDRGKRSVVK